MNSIRPVWLLDTETTGLSKDKDRVLEVALKQFSPAREDAKSWIVNPRCAIPKAATDVHGINAEDIENKPSFAEAWPTILAEIEQSAGNGGADSRASESRPLIVAHNAKFDRAFVEMELSQAGLVVPAWDWVCSVEVARAVWTKTEAADGHGLKALMTMLGVQEFGHHRAGADVEALAAMLDAAADKLGWAVVGGVLGAEGRRAPGKAALQAVLERCVWQDGESSNSRSTVAEGSRASGHCTSLASASGDAEISTAPFANSGGSRSGANLKEKQCFAVPRGKVWHTSVVCGKLARSTAIDALETPPADMTRCSTCAKGISSTATTSTVSTVPASPPAAPTQIQTSPTTSAGGATFYGTEGGECFHTSNDCYGLRKAHRVVTVSDAGRRPCRICSNKTLATASSSAFAIPAPSTLISSDSSPSASASALDAPSGGFPLTQAPASAQLQTSPITPAGAPTAASSSSSAFAKPAPRTLTFSDSSTSASGSALDAPPGGFALTQAPASAQLQTSSITPAGAPMAASSSSSAFANPAPRTLTFSDSSTNASGSALDAPSGGFALTQAPASAQLQTSPITPAGGTTFYGTEGGECFHTCNNCYGLRQAHRVVTVSDTGRRPCRNCSDKSAPTDASSSAFAIPAPRTHTFSDSSPSASASALDAPSGGFALTQAPASAQLQTSPITPAGAPTAASSSSSAFANPAPRTLTLSDSSSSASGSRLVAATTSSGCASTQGLASILLQTSSITPVGSATLYGTEGGECFHTSADCYGLRKVHRVVAVSDAGRHPCRKCSDSETPTASSSPSAVGPAPRRLDFSDISRAAPSARARAAPRGTTATQALVSHALSSPPASYFIAPTGVVYHKSSTCAGLHKARSVSSVDEAPPGRRGCSLCT